MPKRSRDIDVDELSKKLRKLERKLKRVKRHRYSTSPSSREDPTLSAHSYEAAENSMDIFSDDDCNVTRPRLASVVRDVASDKTKESRAPLPAPLLAPPPVSSRAPSPAPQVREPSPPPLPQATESCPVVEPSAIAATTNDQNNDDDDLIDILGDDPTQITEYGKDIHTGLANRLNYLIVNGLDNDVRKELGKKHLIPANCPRIIPPILNAEIKAALPEVSVKRDKGIENRQKQLGTALACLSNIISTKMQEKDKDSALLKQLMDAAKLMCDTLHSDSVKRRYFALSSLKKDVNEHLAPTKIDKYLFGETLADTLKAAKAVTKSGADIKVTYDKNRNHSLPANTYQPQPSTSRGLNWKAPASTRRQSGPQRSRQPYPSAGTRAPPPPTSRPPPPPSARRGHRAISRGRSAAGKSGTICWSFIVICKTMVPPHERQHYSIMD
ncbi:uncharacterized protein LOC110383737 [Helicoverpa armigera]|uniref:uncharacterized protein LOC110383737 n=1 Tax=Helicoverpa armigera TaxID=29058 RepID=UPI003082D28E